MQACIRFHKNAGQIFLYITKTQNQSYAEMLVAIIIPIQSKISSQFRTLMISCERIMYSNHDLMANTPTQ